MVINYIKDYFAEFNSKRWYIIKKIYVATKARGFLLDLFNQKSEYFKFIYSSKMIYETNSLFKIIISKIVKSNFADHLGLIQRVNYNNSECDIVFSYNRFIHSNSKYVIYVENPLALVHYSTRRSKTPYSKKKLEKYFGDPNLKAIICLSKACYDTFENYYSIPPRLLKTQIYPLVRKNNLVDIKQIKQKCNAEKIKCLYISSKFNLKGGSDILAAFQKLRESGVKDITLIIITQVDNLESKIKKIISENDNIELYNFNYNKDELENFYAQSCIYLNPTRQDSFSLVTLEAIKAGNLVLSTDLYALPEMVVDGFNGYLIDPKYRFFNYNNMPNEDVWNNREATIYSDYIDTEIVKFIYEKLFFLYNNRDILEVMALNSYDKSLEPEFNDSNILNKWEILLENI